MGLSGRSSDRTDRGLRGLPRVRALPTRRGWQVLFVGASSLGVALSLGTTQFYQLSYALLGLCVVAFLLGLVGSRALGLERYLSGAEGISAGGSTTVGLRLTNGSRLAHSGVQVVDRLPHHHVFRLPEIPAGEERFVESTVSFPRRGLYTIGPAQVTSTDPFGLLRFRRDSGLEREALVYPEVHDVSGLPVRGGEEAGGRARPTARGEEFSGLREYRPGDDRRFIHWKSVARTGEMLVKEFDPDVPHRYSVVLDLPGPPALGTALAGRDGRELEDAVSAAASVVSYLDGAGLTYRLCLTDRASSSTSFGSGARAGHEQYHAAMRLLAEAGADGNLDTGEALRREAAGGGLGETVIVIHRGVTESSRSGRDRDQEPLTEALREISVQGVAAVAILLAPHTYSPQSPGGGPVYGDREARLAELAGELRGSGAVVRVLRREDGVVELSEARGRETV